MADDRADGPTFALDDIMFLDFESRSQTDIKAGTYRYACEADAIVLVYAIGNGSVHTIAVKDFSQPLTRRNLPPEIAAFHARVIAGKAVYAAWNAGFDRAIWNFATLGFPEMKPHHIIDVMAQATASGLPADLNYSAKFSGSTHKVASGKALIGLFCVPDATATPQSHPAEWAEFLDYAAGDIVAMRDVFLRTRQLPLAEWKEYWAMEAINARGIGVDLNMVEAAAKLAEQDKVRSNQELLDLTLGDVKTVDQVKAMTEWLLRHLPPQGRDILLKREVEIDEFGTETRPAKYSLSRKQVERLLAWLDAEVDSWPMTVVLDAIYRVLQIRLYGGSKTPAKFQRIIDSHVDGTLYGQYVFNGAAQTGRASSKGVQIHNLARDTLAYEHEAIEALLAGTDYDSFAALGDASPVSRKLSLLIRPAFVPRETNVFVWSDWAQIEARVLPWLCDHLPGAAARLGTFRAVDKDPNVPDLYTRTAAELSRVPVAEVTRAMRQRGKVTELACFAADTRILTDSGVKPITAVKLTDKLWDGETWVMHQGMISRGLRSTINLDGVNLTPEHLVKTNGTWTPARQLVSNENIRYQALATGSASLSLLATSTKAKVVAPTSWRNARAMLRRIVSRSITYAAEDPRVATLAQRSNQITGVKTSLATSISFLTTRIAAGFSIVSLLATRVVTLQTINSMTTMAGVAFTSSLIGVKAPKADANFLLIWSRLTAGISRRLNWIGSTSIRAMNPVTCVSLHAARTRPTNAPSWPCNYASRNLKLVYDIAHAGPHNRFTILTDTGALIVHNCGYGGGVNSLQVMAANYGLHLSDEEAKSVVDAWRAANPWAGQFAQELWRAMEIARYMPGEPVQCGRCVFIYLARYLGGSLLIRLPSGRCLTYRALRYEMVDEKDDDGKVVKTSRELTYAKGHNRVKIWPGVLVENCTQAVAACILRGTLVRLENRASWMPVRLHTHDEVLVETEIGNELDARQSLREIMQLGFNWSDGLPLMSEEKIYPYYSKHGG